MSNVKIEFPSGMKRTKQREWVYRILSQAERPISAVDIFYEIEKLVDAEPLALSTVYRILNTFTEHGLLEKTTIMDNDTTVFELKGQQHKHYAVCVGCHKMLPLEECPFHDFEPKVADENFQVVGHKVEIYGYCQECINNKKKENKK